VAVAFLGKRPQGQEFVEGNIRGRKGDAAAQCEVQIKRAAQEPARIGFKRIIEPDKRAGIARRRVIGRLRAEPRAIAEVFAPE
jgi:hypothetical protein